MIGVHKEVMMEGYRGSHVLKGNSSTTGPCEDTIDDMLKASTNY